MSTKTYIVTLMDVDASDILVSVASRTARTKTEAMRVAKRLAGRGAEFRREGNSYGYAGPKGTAWVVC